MRRSDKALDVALVAAIAVSVVAAFAVSSIFAIPTLAFSLVLGTRTARRPGSGLVGAVHRCRARSAATCRCRKQRAR